MLAVANKSNVKIIKEHDFGVNLFQPNGRAQRIKSKQEKIRRKKSAKGGKNMSNKMRGVNKKHLPLHNTRIPL